MNNDMSMGFTTAGALVYLIGLSFIIWSRVDPRETVNQQIQARKAGVIMWIGGAMLIAWPNPSLSITLAGVGAIITILAW